MIKHHIKFLGYWKTHKNISKVFGWSCSREKDEARINYSLYLRINHLTSKSSEPITDVLKFNERRFFQTAGEVWIMPRVNLAEGALITERKLEKIVSFMIEDYVNYSYLRTKAKVNY